MKEYSDSFLDFWKAFKGRWSVDRGKCIKGSKWDAFIVWEKLSVKHRQLARQAAPRTGYKYTKDACRWLKSRDWEEFEDVKPKIKPVELPQKIKKLSPEDKAKVEKFKETFGRKRVALSPAEFEQRRQQQLKQLEGE